MSEKKFICLRYFIVPTNQDSNSNTVNSEKKLEWLKASFLGNHDYPPYRGVEYAIRAERVAGTSLYSGKLSRQTSKEIFEKTPTNFHETTMEDWPYISFLCNTDPKIQIAVFERDHRMIRNVDSFCRVLDRHVNRKMREYQHTISFKPINDETAFWDTVETADGIYSLEFSLNSPNIFGSKLKANAGLKWLKDKFNNSKTTLTLTNSLNKLNLLKSKHIIEDYREYADKGGGSWILIVLKNKKKQRIRSSDRAMQITIIPLNETEFEILEKAFNIFMKRIASK